ncbi:MAG: hypothetical protein ACRC42_02025, partial [Mycoplasma sp.]
MWTLWFATKMTAMTPSAKKAFDEQMSASGNNMRADKLSALVQTDVDAALNELSRLYTTGVLSYEVLMKIVGTRHVSQIATTLQTINGDIELQKKLFLENKDLGEDADKAMDSWSNSIRKLKNEYDAMNTSMSNFVDGVGSDVIGSLSAILRLINSSETGSATALSMFLTAASGFTIAKGTVSAVASLSKSASILAGSATAAAAVGGWVVLGATALAGLYGYIRAQNAAREKNIQL